MVLEIVTVVGEGKVCLNSVNRRHDSLGHKQVVGLKPIENTIQEATV
jgi:hypothetical protein